jgi:hypothetical protein
MRELALQCGAQFEAVIVERLVMAARQPVQPEMLEARRPVILAGRAERMEIGFAAILPVVEEDAELERRLRLSHELGFVDPKQAVTIGGIVDSPTPTVPIASDSTSVTATVRPIVRAIAAAAIQPAVPPPAMTTRWIGGVVIG